MKRPLILGFCGWLLIAASPAREQYHWLPAPDNGKPRPWAVMLPRAVGVGRLEAGNQYFDLAQHLHAKNIDVLVIDYDRAGPLVPAAKGRTGPKLAAIVNDALADAREQRRMDMRCPGVAIGWSRGGEGALTLASKSERGMTGIKAAIVYYPSVRGQDRPWRQLHPVLALQGTGDGTAPAKALKALVASRPDTGVEFRVRLYEGAKHRFDVAHPVDEPAGKPTGDYDATASAAALAEIDRFLDDKAIGVQGCALD